GPMVATILVRRKAGRTVGTFPRENRIRLFSRNTRVKTLLKHTIVRPFVWQQMLNSAITRLLAFTKFASLQIDVFCFVGEAI
ncbi:MAG: hypothetical protein WBA01_10720, partial [Phormidesmis sp.]